MHHLAQQISPTTTWRHRKSHNKSGHIDNCELLIHRTSSMRCKLWVSVTIQPNVVTNATVGCVAFIITYFKVLYIISFMTTCGFIKLKIILYRGRL